MPREVTHPSEMGLEFSALRKETTMRSHYRLGFSLIELLIVIAIIAILAAILFPTFGRVREQSRQTTCMTNMHQIQVAASLFHQDNNKWPCMLLGPAERPDGYL